MPIRPLRVSRHHLVITTFAAGRLRDGVVAQRVGVGLAINMPWVQILLGATAA